MILVRVRSLHFCWGQTKYAIVFRTQYWITIASQIKTDVGFAILIDELPICVFDRSEFYAVNPSILISIQSRM